ncbi:hypothetical protein FVE85_1457 [Porphyridium purpureum]|uniref:Uncharacterized protein n=1 Tax=Porphyridium purpureum TaxID=35688 RepID=A0A5J4YWR3_PORPP|nr:hypothetical protein FVE85_1457 [Porphyridium purpureum]|eukprot:POR3359..scf209_3
MVERRVGRMARQWRVALALSVVLVVTVALRRVGTAHGQNDSPVVGLKITVGPEVSDKLALDAAEVLRDGQVLGKWKACDELMMSRAGVDPNSAEAQAACVVLDGYVGRLVLEFEYVQSVMIFMEPDLTTTNSKVDPQIQYFDNDQDERAGEFAVVFDCSRGARQSSFIRVIADDFDIGAEDDMWDDDEDGIADAPADEKKVVKSYSFAFVKTCGSGAVPGVLISHLDLETKEKTKFPSGLVVPVDIMVTHFTLDLEDPTRFFAMQKPVLESLDPRKLKVSLQGNLAYGGNVVWMEQGDIGVFYQCEEEGIFDVHLSIPCPPFDTIKLNWKKNCPPRKSFDSEEGFVNDFDPADVKDQEEEEADGEALGGDGAQPAREPREQDRVDSSRADAVIPMIDRIMVGLNGQHDPNVFAAGVAAPGFAVDTEKLDKADSGALYRLPVSVSEIEFVIWNADSAQRLAYNAIEIVPAKPDIVRGFVQPSGTSLFDKYLAANHADSIPSDGARLALMLVCRDKGESVVAVSVLLKTMKRVEFGIIKECAAPRRIKRRRASAAVLMNVVLVVLGFAAGFYMLHVIRQTGSIRREYQKHRIH